MILIETSVLVDAIRDTGGSIGRTIVEFAADREIVISSFTELELLVGARNDGEWQVLESYVATRRILQPNQSTWNAAARIHFDLRRQGQTVRSIVDCCIAQMALENDILLLHDDRDFEAIATVRPLKHERSSHKREQGAQ